MRFLKKVMHWLNGKKTAFGMVLLGAGQVAALFGKPEFAKLLEMAGGLLGAAGVAHKLAKGELTDGGEKPSEQIDIKF